MRQHNDHRRHYRKNALIIAEYTISDGTFQGVLKDISAGGLYIRTVTMPQAGQTVSLEFSLFTFEKTISVSGIVARVGADGFAVKFDEPIEQLACAADAFPKIVNEGDR